MAITTVDTEERCRTAVARLPPTGALTRALGRRHRTTVNVAAVVVGVGGFALIVTGVPSSITLAVLVSSLVLLLLERFLVLQPAAETCARGDRAFVTGRVDDAAVAYDALVGRAALRPAARAVAALGLARCAVVAGHAERGIVLLRAIDASGALPREHDGALHATTALALLTLGRADDARTVAARVEGPSGDGVRLLVEALGGPIEVALAAAARPPSDPAPVDDPAWHAQRVRLGWLVRAWVAERERRASSDHAAAAAEARRDQALVFAADVAPWMHRHLHAAWPDFGAFAAAPPAPTAHAPRHDHATP